MLHDDLVHGFMETTRPQVNYSTELLITKPTDSDEATERALYCGVRMIDSEEPLGIAPSCMILFKDARTGSCMAPSNACAEDHVVTDGSFVVIWEINPRRPTWKLKSASL